jgi:hypothetical protein
LRDIAEVWRRGSVIASWLLDLTAASLVKDPSSRQFAGRVSGFRRGRWTIKAAIDEAVPVPVLSTALYQRFSSRGEADYQDRLLSAMRFGFGGTWRKQPASRMELEISMSLEVFDDPDSVARAASATIAADARTAIAARNRFTLAVSGGHTPWIMLRALANEDIPWAGMHLFQIDERVAP